jgi:hypothetical protein
MSKLSKLVYVLKNATTAYDLLTDNKKISFKYCSSKFEGEDNYYIINPKYRLSGFFGIYRAILSYLYVADKLNFKPYIDLQETKFNVPGGYKGINNMWEYYYLNNKLPKSYNAFVCDNNHTNLVYNTFFVKESMYANGYIINEEYLRALGNISRKYVKYNNETDKYLKNQIKNIGINSKTLGVHIRGTDFALGYGEHPKVVSASDYFKEIDKLLESKKYDKIFLATDDQNLLNEFLKKYKDKIIYYKDAQRSSLNVHVAFQSNSRKNNEYLNGLEVIRDMYTLSMCDGLIAGLSQVATCARIEKYSYSKSYKDLIILDNGLYERNDKKDKEISKYETKFK